MIPSLALHQQQELLCLARSRCVGLHSQILWRICFDAMLQQAEVQRPKPPSRAEYSRSKSLLRPARCELIGSGENLADVTAEANEPRVQCAGTISYRISPRVWVGQSLLDKLFALEDGIQVEAIELVAQVRHQRREEDVVGTLREKLVEEAILVQLSSAELLAEQQSFICLDNTCSSRLVRVSSDPKPPSANSAPMRRGKDMLAPPSHTMEYDCISQNRRQYSQLTPHQAIRC